MRKQIKRAHVFLILASILVVLSACAMPIEENPSVTSIESKTDPIALFGTFEFDDAICDNPIDKAFEEVGYSGPTVQVIEACNQFRFYWEAEMDAACEKLYALLRDEDADALRNAQQAWTEYMASNHDLRISMFYEDFMSDEPYGIASGTLDKALMNTVRMEETRRRALELMEYYYRFTGEVQFVFEGWP